MRWGRGGRARGREVVLRNVGTDRVESLRRHGRRGGKVARADVELKIVDEVGGHARVLKDLLHARPEMERVPAARRVSLGSRNSPRTQPALPCWTKATNAPETVDQDALQQLDAALAAGHELQGKDSPKLVVVEAVALKRPRAGGGGKDGEQHKGPRAGEVSHGDVGG